MKYWTIEKKTREVICSGEADKWNIPRNVLLVEPLPPKEGFAVVATDNLNGTEYIEDHRGKTVYNKQAPTQSQVVTQLGAIEDGWTLNKPATQFDNWDNQLDDWVTDLQAKYEFDYQQVNSTRGSLYSQIVDRLNSEAEMIRRTEGNEAKALDYEAQANAAYVKIREDNPWPLPPEA